MTCRRCTRKGLDRQGPHDRDRRPVRVTDDRGTTCGCSIVPSACQPRHRSGCCSRSAGCRRTTRTTPRWWPRPGRRRRTWSGPCDRAGSEHPAGRDAGAGNGHGRRLPEVHGGRELRDHAQPRRRHQPELQPAGAELRGRSALSRLRYAYRNARRHHVTVLAASNDSGSPVRPQQAPSTCTESSTGRRRIPSSPASAAPGCISMRPVGGPRPTPPGTTPTSRCGCLEKRAFPWASNGGVSALFGRPAYQDPVRVIGNHRGVPDVAMSASLSGAVLVFASIPGLPGSGFTGGTSGATGVRRHRCDRRPVRAQTIGAHQSGALSPGAGAHARNRRRHQGQQHGQRSRSRRKTFTLKGYQAKRGYDLVTGVGTVDAGRLVPELARTG